MPNFFILELLMKEPCMTILDGESLRHRGDLQHFTGRIYQLYHHQIGNTIKVVPKKKAIQWSFPHKFRWVSWIPMVLTLKSPVKLPIQLLDPAIHHIWLGHGGTTFFRHLRNQHKHIPAVPKWSSQLWSSYREKSPSPMAYLWCWKIAISSAIKVAFRTSQQEAFEAFRTR